MKRQLLNLLLLFIIGSLTQVSLAQSDILYGQRNVGNAGSGETPAVTFLRGGGEAKIGFYTEEKEKITFLIEGRASIPGVVGVNLNKSESPNPNSVRVTIKPKIFQISAGRDYSINTSYFDPWIQKAEKDGELIIELNEPSNCTVVIEDAQDGNKL